LPESIDVDGVTADLKDGILTVAIPKARDRGTRRIDVG
jgi:HSP20 family molecular chaperone IbpA